MMAARKLCALWQKVREMAAPCGRVLARAVALRLGRVQNGLDASAQPRSGFGLFEPNRLQDGQDGLCINLVDWPGGGSAHNSPAASSPIVPHAWRFAHFAWRRLARWRPLQTSAFRRLPSRPRAGLRWCFGHRPAFAAPRRDVGELRRVRPRPPSRGPSSSPCPAMRSERPIFARQSARRPNRAQRHRHMSPASWLRPPVPIVSGAACQIIDLSEVNAAPWVREELDDGGSRRRFSDGQSKRGGVAGPRPRHSAPDAARPRAPQPRAHAPRGKARFNRARRTGRGRARPRRSLGKDRAQARKGLRAVIAEGEAFEKGFRSLRFWPQTINRPATAKSSSESNADERPARTPTARMIPEAWS